MKPALFLSSSILIYEDALLNTAKKNDKEDSYKLAKPLRLGELPEMTRAIIELEHHNVNIMYRYRYKQKKGHCS